MIVQLTKIENPQWKWLPNSLLKSVTTSTETSARLSLIVWTALRFFFFFFFWILIFKTFQVSSVFHKIL